MKCFLKVHTLLCKTGEPACAVFGYFEAIASIEICMIYERNNEKYFKLSL